MPPAPRRGGRRAWPRPRLAGAAQTAQAAAAQALADARDRQGEAREANLLTHRLAALTEQLDAARQRLPILIASRRGWNRNAPTPTA
jgi:uncharacterized protein YicC (UPF0701 family)